MTAALSAVTVTVNGRARAVLAAPPLTLLEALRDQLGLTGAKRGCNQGVCGACTVLVDGRPVRGCLTLAASCDGRSVTTIEGLAQGTRMSRVQQAFTDLGAVQCGFCTAGMVLTASAFLEENPAPTVDEVRTALSGNLCRCTGYRRIVDAVLRAAEGAGPATATEERP